MKIKRTIYFFFKVLAIAVCSLFWSSNDVYATRGCQGTSGPAFALYTVSTSPFTDGNGVTYSEVWEQSSAINNPNNTNCITTTSEPCKVRKSGTNTVYSTAAFIVDYTPITLCPLDDSIWILFGIASIFAITVLRKKTSLI